VRRIADFRFPNAEWKNGEMMKKTSLFFAVVMLAAVASWASPCEECQRVSLKPLDLSRTPTHEELVEAGQLGGNLSPTAPEIRSTSSDRKAFGEAMDAWNRHDYKKALPLLKKHIRQFPESPWKDESELHLGCEARFNGRYTEAEEYFKGIIAENEQAGRNLSDDNEYSEVARKARLRMAMLEFLRGNYDESEKLWGEIIQTDPDRRRVDYARNWLRRTGLFRANAAETRRCAVESLSRFAQVSGKPELSESLRGVMAHPEYGFRADELVALAAQEGIELKGVKAESAKAVPTPFIAHYRFGHFVTVTAKDRKGNLTVYDPILNLETKMTAKDFAREWSGFALVQADKLEKRSFFSSFLPFGNRQSAIDHANELRSFTGGCCGIENVNTDEGNGEPMLGGPDCGGSGICTWAFNPVSMNILMWDTPLWYQPAIGPSIEFSMSYNVIDADNNLPSFGPKWFFNYHSYAVETPATSNGSVTVFMPDGGNDVYSPIPATNTFTSPARVFNKLTKIAANQYTLEFPDGTLWQYGAPQGATNVQQALLSRIVDTHSNAVTLLYDGQPSPKLVAVADALSYTSRIDYADGKIAQITDPFGRSMSVVYSNGYVSTVTDMGGVQSVYSFYDSGTYRDRVKSVRTMDGEVAFSYTNIWKRERITATYEDGTAEVLYYNGGEQYVPGIGWAPFTDYTDRSGNKTRYLVKLNASFPYQGAIDYAQAPDESRVYYKYNSALQATNVVDEMGKNWSFSYNPQGSLTRTVAPNGYQADFTYASNGFDLAAVSEAGQLILSIGYTAERDVAAITNALNRSTAFSYDSYGRLTNITDEANISIAYEYGPNFWLSRIRRAGQTLSTYSFDAPGRVTNSIGPDQISAAMEYDSLNRLTGLRLPGEQPYRWLYESNSMNLAETFDRTGRRTRYSFDEVNRITRLTAHDWSFTGFEYTGGGALKTLIDAEGKRTRFAYDNRNRLTHKTYPEEDGTQAAYASNSLLESFTSCRGIITAFKYDSAGLLTNLSYSATNTAGVRYRYDPRNRLEWMADGWGTNSYFYDNLSQVTQWLEIGVSGTQRFTYAYNALGQATSVLWQCTTLSVQTAYFYDELGRVTSIVSDAGTFGYSYANAGVQLSRLVYPNTEAASWSYDALGRMTNLAYSTGGSWSYAYDARDQVVRRIDPSTNVYTYAYDDQSRLTEAKGLKGTNKVFGYPWRWKFDRVGNVIERAETNSQLNFTYNADNQLIRYERPTETTVRGYVNERSSVALRSNTATNWVPAVFKFVSATQTYFEGSVSITNWGTNNYVWVRATDSSGNISTSRVRVASYWTSQDLSWDADGNYSAMKIGTNQYVQTWDAENRLVSYAHAWSNFYYDFNLHAWVSAHGSKPTVFRYDGSGRLREITEHRTNGTIETRSRFVWNGWMPVGELDASNKLVRTFTWGVDLSGSIGGAGGIGGLLAIRQGGTNYFVRSDGKGNVVEVRRTNGVVVGAYSYSPYGKILSQTNTYNQPFRWASKLFHTRSGFYYFGLRWYLPGFARFASREPLGESASINLYSYCYNSPVTLIDPLGDQGFNPEAEALKKNAVGLQRLQLEMLPSVNDTIANINRASASSYASRCPPAAARQSNLQLLQNIAARAQARIGGLGARSGTFKHTFAKRMLDKFQKLFDDRGLLTERSWKDGDKAKYGAKGSVRTDVYDPASGTVYDYKFVQSPPGLSANQVQRIVANGPGINAVVEVNP